MKAVRRTHGHFSIERAIERRLRRTKALPRGRTVRKRKTQTNISLVRNDPAKHMIVRMNSELRNSVDDRGGFLCTDGHATTFNPVNVS